MARGSNIWLNGKILPAEEAKLSLFSHVIHYGTGAFEGIRAYKQKAGGGAIFRLREHMERLEDSIKIMGFDIGFSVEELMQAAIDVCKANNFEECYLRPIAFIGDGPLGVFPGLTPKIEVAILTWEWGSYLGDKGINEGAKLMTSTFARPQVNSVLSKGKVSGQYVMGVAAKREAIQAGFDEALMLDVDGFMTEGTGENLFIISGGKVKTTPLTSILNGITRNTVMQMIEKRGLKLEEQRFTRDELWVADEVFLTGTAAEITPVSEVDRRKIGRGPKAGKPGEVSLMLQRDYNKLVRGELVSEFPKHWLTLIK
ncbi:MAG: branched-chain amino acid transaminase [Bdellovibrionales bacterium]|nr:branched-chain amino acid transaminase [Bdellovibrionales bacterium]